MEHYLTFGDGFNLSDYNVLLSGEGVFNAPRRDVEMITIPGRNGDLSIDRGRFENIEIEYPCGIKSASRAAFSSALSDIRNALSSIRGYQKLQDTFHPDEYRMAVFRDGFEAAPIKDAPGASFTLKFNAKPQRFLLSGDEWVDISDSAQQTIERQKTISLATNTQTTLDGVTVRINPTITHTGATSPDNLAEILTQSGIKIKATETSGANTNVSLYEATFPLAVLGGTFNPLTGALSVTQGGYTVTGTEGILKLSTLGDDVFALQGITTGWTNAENLVFFSNLFRWNSQGATGIASASYRGSISTPSRFVFRMDGVTTVSAVRQIFQDLYQAGTPVVITSLLATPESYTVTPAMSWTPSLDNAITKFELQDPDGSESLISDLTITATTPTTLSNPTLFESHPLIEVTGNGTVEFADVTITVDNLDTTEPVFIDCEVMEAWVEVDGQIESRNNIVTMDNNNFPVLPVGASTVYADSGITSLRVKPRWWKL